VARSGDEPAARWSGDPQRPLPGERWAHRPSDAPFTETALGLSASHLPTLITDQKVLEVGSRADYSHNATKLPTMQRTLRSAGLSWPQRRLAARCPEQFQQWRDDRPSHWVAERLTWLAAPAAPRGSQEGIVGSTLIHKDFSSIRAHVRGCDP